jgi:hypothetical protein
LALFQGKMDYNLRIFHIFLQNLVMYSIIIQFGKFVRKQFVNSNVNCLKTEKNRTLMQRGTISFLEVLTGSKRFRALFITVLTGKPCISFISRKTQPEMQNEEMGTTLMIVITLMMITLMKAHGETKSKQNFYINTLFFE